MDKIKIRENNKRGFDWMEIGGWQISLNLIPRQEEDEYKVVEISAPVIWLKDVI